MGTSCFTDKPAVEEANPGSLTIGAKPLTLRALCSSPSSQLLKHRGALLQRTAEEKHR